MCYGFYIQFVIRMAKMYIPLTKEEQQAKATKIAQRVCPLCPHDYDTGCKKCIWYLIMNGMIGEEEF